MKEKVTKNMILNQHSALTTFQLDEGKYYTTGVEKSVFALLFRSQQDMIASFRNNLKEKLAKIVKEKDLDSLIDWIYTGKEFDISMDEIVPIELKKISQEIMNFQEQEVFKRTGDPETRKKLLKDFEKTFLSKLSNLGKNLELLENREEFSSKKQESDSKNLEKIIGGKNPEQASENIKNILFEVKEYCKDITVKDYMELKTIDLTALSNSIETNLTYLKKDLKSAVGTKLKFNYINRKKLDVDVVSTLIASVSFENDKAKKTTWMTYQIPIEILKLLLIPEIYVPLSGLVIQNIKGIYSIRMYGFLKDHIKRGEVELSKEEIFTFFMLPKSYEKKAHFLNKFLEPTLHEVETNSGIKTEYEFLPSRNWERIRFRIKKGADVVVPEIKVVTAEESKKNMESIQEPLAHGIEKIKRNIYVSKSWNKYSENKIYKIAKEKNVEFALKIMDIVQKNLNAEITTTLVQYINGVLRRVEKEEKQKPAKKVKVVPEKKKQEKKISEIEQPENINNGMTELLYNMFLEMKEEKKQEIIAGAKELFKEKSGIKKFTKFHEGMFAAAEKILVVEILQKKQMN
ncbi:MAG: hypothetical protein ACRCR2_09755 [Fusobacteriaceae bacterium]